MSKRTALQFSKQVHLQLRESSWPNLNASWPTLTNTHVTETMLSADLSTSSPAWRTDNPRGEPWTAPSMQSFPLTRPKEAKGKIQAVFTESQLVWTSRGMILNLLASLAAEPLAKSISSRTNWSKSTMRWNAFAKMWSFSTNQSSLSKLRNLSSIRWIILSSLGWTMFSRKPTASTLSCNSSRAVSSLNTCQSRSDSPSKRPNFMQLKLHSPSVTCTKVISSIAIWNQKIFCLTTMATSCWQISV